MIICVWNLLFVYNILSALIVFTALPGVGALKFLKAEPFALTGYMGMNIDIDCSTDDPNATVTLLHQPSFKDWFVKPVTPNKLMLNGQVFTLLNLGITDGGRYNCKAIDSLNNAIRWSQFKGLLLLQSGALPSYFELVPKKPKIVLQGQGGQISCEAEGYTVSKLTWKKLTNSGEVSVPDSMVTNVIDKADNLVKAILTITNARLEDGGDYKCVLTAFNKQDHKLTSIRVEGLAFLKKPQIVLEGYLSRNLEIDCSTNDGNAAVSLLHKYHPLVAFTERQLKAKKLSRKGQVFKLLNLDAGDAGIYACEARSQASEIVRWPHGTGYLFLSHARLPDYFVLKPAEKPILVLKGQDANVTCESEGIAVTKLQWKKQTSSRYVSVPDGMVTIVKDRSTNRVRAVLKITNAQMQDGGFYKCVLRVFGKKDYKFTRIVIGEI